MNTTIIIPNYNGDHFLKKCMTSLNNKKFNNNIIIIDNGSVFVDDNFFGRFSNVNLVKLDDNKGFSKAVNQGIKLSDTELIILLNNDTEIKDGFIENLIQSISLDEKIFSVSSKMIQYHNRDKMDDAGDEYTLLGWAYQNGHGKDTDTRNKPKEIFSSCAGAAIYRKSILDEIGYFDENFFAYMEDVDIGYRARIHGYKNVYCPEAVVYHIGSATSGSKYNAFKVRLAARNNVYVPYKNMPLLQLMFNLPFLVIGFVIKYIFFIGKGLGKEYREGLWEGFTTLSKIDKIKFQWKNLGNYFRIEGLLIKNTFKYLFSKIF